MQEWIKEHKYYILAGVILVAFLAYYAVTSVKPPITTAEKNTWDESRENEEIIDNEKEVEPAAEPEEILVDVKGAVKKPGVYKAQTGERAIDLINKAGGLNERADSKGINFAMRVTDEMVLYIPSAGENIEGIQSTVSFSGGGDGDGGANADKVNLNRATQADLETLPGIGEAKALAIIEYRETNGPFKKIEDIMLISGFGEKTFEKLKDKIVVN
jgi:competence protein ComEA